MSEASAPSADPQLYVTDGGIETDLVQRGATLDEFAAFPLLDTAAGVALLRQYYADYVAIARASGRGLLLEGPTWRANPDWGDRLGYTAPDLARVNAAAIAFLTALRTEHAHEVGPILVSGTVGPRYDGYSSEESLEPDEATDYHRPQLAAFAAAGADLATAYTLTHVGEAVGIVRAARAVGLPIAVSFTVAADGRLPSRVPLREAIEQVDAAAAPDYFLVNCAHPSHIEQAVSAPGPWTGRIAGTRANASTDGGAGGDPREFAAAQRRLDTRLPHLTILGGCCGTDPRHIAALVGADPAVN